MKDTLEGDNMYTCSQCGKKVRAEKRACFKKLPQILCFNTMRYTFNMLTMLKEKVNTHFSFPLRLNMAGYVEKQLMTQHYQDEKAKNGDPESEQYEYDLIGVTVHTGTADGVITIASSKTELLVRGTNGFCSTMLKLSLLIQIKLQLNVSVVR